MRKLSYDNVVATMSANKRRMFPNPKKGMDRLRPFPKPFSASTSLIPADAKFFAVGNCFARSLEKGLMLGGYKTLSSAYHPEIPGTAMEQFQRYNIFNLDVSTNEIEWATGQRDDIDSALVAVGDQLVDMQLHFTIAYPPDEMRRLRRLYNKPFTRIAEADVILAVLGNGRQWFDAHKDLYLNSMPTHKMGRLYPGRFELHEFDVDDARRNIERFVRVTRNVNRNALILVAISPVQPPSTASERDILIEQLHARAIQRVALESVCDAEDGIEYFPAWEAAVLSDARTCYIPKNPGHTFQHFGYRVLADALAERKETSVRQKILEAYGYAMGLEAIKDFPPITDLLSPLLSGGEGGLGSIGPAHPYLHKLFASALYGVGRPQEAFDHIIRAIKARMETSTDALGEGVESVDGEDGEASFAISPQDDWAKVYSFGVNLLSQVGSSEDVAVLECFAERFHLDTERLVDRKQARSFDAALLELEKMSSDAEADLLPLIRKLDDSRAQLTPKQCSRLDQSALRWGVSSGRIGEVLQRSIEILFRPDTALERDSLRQLANTARAHATLPQLEAIMELAHRAGLEPADVERLALRREQLLRSAARAATSHPA